MSKYSDETLMAYADGELDTVLRAEIEAELQHDPAAAHRVEEFRTLRAQLVADFEPELEEPVPDALEAWLTQPGAEIVDFQVRRTERPAVGRSFGPSGWLAIAASLAVGVAAGWLIRAPSEDLPLRVVGGEMLAVGSLSAALQRDLASQPGSGLVHIGLTFRDQRGRVCRTFSNSGRPAVSGLACHVDAGWRLEVVTQDATAAGPMREAGSMPPIIAHVVESRIAGRPFDADAERAARDAGWR